MKSCTIADHCHWEQVACVDDSDCAEGYDGTLYRIMDFPIEGDCVEMGTCEDVGERESQEQRLCFPKRIDCSSDQDCPTEWSCTDFASLEEFEVRARAGLRYGPIEWQTPENPSIVACLPKTSVLKCMPVQHPRGINPLDHAVRVTVDCDYGVVVSPLIRLPYPDICYPVVVLVPVYCP